ncbi:protein deadpan [Eupeodes corollae]|uniref:protein deadpan n=1 Tax=Eupeodes corollae TaxID=290404 RepID=UPI0024928AA0|nr:protein deadpan [Eupeodes corollae]
MDYNINSNSDDDFDGSCNSYTNDVINNQTNNNQMNNASGMSKAELRRSNKPIMEKRRRARINHCLNELKSLILEAMKKDPARHTKLEKADILEMTVKHLQSMQRRQLSMAIQTDPTVIHKFKTGFVECADEVKRYISQLDGVDNGTRQRLSNYLNNCANSLEQIGSFSNFSNSLRSQTTQDYVNPAVIPTQIPFAASHEKINNNGCVQLSGVNLIPSVLPSGEFALIMPKHTNLKARNDNDVSSFCPPNIRQTNVDFLTSFPRASAFSKPVSKTVFPKPTSYDINVSVQPSATTTSPPLSPISSVSSHEEDSIMHNSSDFTSRSITPPLDGSGSSFSGGFTTPSSSESNKTLPRTMGALQQSHVTSSSEIPYSCKRLYPYAYTSSPENSMKKLKKEKPEHSDSNGNLKKELEESSENMWRPW